MEVNEAKIIDNAIKLHNLRKTFVSGEEEIHAVDNLNLQIEQGEFVIIMGPSGSGKSTLLNLIAGLSSVSEGKIVINGQDMHNLSENQKSLLRRSELGIIFQFYNLHEGLTAQENIELPMMIAGIPLRERRERSNTLIDLVGMSKRRDHRPHELSGGEKQRIGIARSLSNNASIILADEPTGDLDNENGKKILDLLMKINEQKVTIVLVTHDSTLIKKGFRLIRLKDGKMVFDGIIDDPDAVRDDFSPLVANS